MLDREHRPDGGAHRRQRHGRPAADPDRRPLPAAARPGDDRHPRGRGRDRRLERPVRRQPGDRGDPRHRDEPARLALLGAGVEGDGLPDRQDRRAPGRGLHARRDSQRHHDEHAGELRADDRLRRREVAALRLREVPWREPDPLHPHEERRRGHGDRPDLPAGVRQGDAQSRARLPAAARRRAGRPAGVARAARSRALRRAAGVPAPRREHRGGPCALPRRPVVPARAAGARARPAGAVRRRALVQVGRHMRRRVRGAHAVLLLRLGAARGRRGRARRPSVGRDPGRRPEPDRPGHRVRLLLRPRCHDGARVRARRGDDQLQPGDGARPTTTRPTASTSSR